MPDPQPRQGYAIEFVAEAVVIPGDANDSDTNTNEETQ